MHMSAVLMAMAIDVKQTAVSKNPQWTDQELFTMKQALPFYSDEAVADLLPGRSVNAVHLMRQRLGIPASSRSIGYLTVNQAAIKLGLNDARRVSGWMRQGRISGHYLKARRKIGMILEISLRRFIVNPLNWILFNVNDVVDDQYKRLIELQKKRWNDEWLTTRQAADMRGCQTSDILRHVSLRRLNATRVEDATGRRSGGQAWAFWYVKKSDILNLDIVRRGEDQSFWTDRADQFVLLAAACGISSPQIARMVGVSGETVAKRLKRLNVREQLKTHPDKKFISIRHGHPHADWRKFKHRFRVLNQAVQRYKSGVPTAEDLYSIYYMLYCQARAYGLKLPVTPGRLSIQKIKTTASYLRKKGCHPYL